jgi:hypothetical protein
MKRNTKLIVLKTTNIFFAPIVVHHSSRLIAIVINKKLSKECENRKGNSHQPANIQENTIVASLAKSADVFQNKTKRLLCKQTKLEYIVIYKQ